MNLITLLGYAAEAETERPCDTQSCPDVALTPYTFCADCLDDKLEADASYDYCCPECDSN